MSRKAEKFPLGRPSRDATESREIARESKASLSADRGAEGVSEGLAEALDVGFVFCFHHDAGQLLGSGITKNNAAVFAKSRLRFRERPGNFRQRIERRFRTHLHVDDLLGIIP